MPPTSSRTENGGDALTSPVSFQLEQPPWGDSTETNGRKAQVKSAENGSLEVPTNPHGISLFLATVFVVGGVAGIGILALPYSIVETGWVGLFLIIASAFASGYSGWKLGACWTILEERWVEYRAHVRDPYPSIAFRAYGKWAKLFTSTVQIMGLFGYGSVFILLSAELVMDVMRQFFGEKVTLTFCYWLIIISAAMGVLMLLGTPKDFGFAAFGAMGATAAAFLIVVGVCCARMHDGRAAFPRHPPHIGLAMFFRGFGTIMFSYGGAAMFPTIQNDMRDRSRFPMAVAYATIALVGLYVVMAYTGIPDLWQRSRSQHPDVHRKSKDTLASQQSSRGSGSSCERPIMLALLFTTETVPHFGKVLPLVGSFMVGLTTFILPCLFYYKLCSEKSPEWKERTIPTWEKVVILVILVAGLIGTIAGTCASIEDLVKPGAFALPCFIDPNVKP
ncbi:hypothetical protein MTO96_004509 [Rhipicephalus appendiculatus]